MIVRSLLMCSCTRVAPVPLISSQPRFVAKHSTKNTAPLQCIDVVTKQSRPSQVPSCPRCLFAQIMLDRDDISEESNS